MVTMGLRSFLRFLTMLEPLEVGGRASFLVRSASTSLPLIAADAVYCFRCKKKERKRASREESKERKKSPSREARRGECGEKERRGGGESRCDKDEAELGKVGIDKGWQKRKKRCRNGACGCCLSGCRI